MHTLENRERHRTGVANTALPVSPAPVAAAYQGVWARTLLETPAGRDTATWVRWMQTARCHGAFGRSGLAASACERGPLALHNVFQTSERIVQTGLHDRYLAVWERLPASRGGRVALARRDASGQPTSEQLLLCGAYLMHIAPQAPTADALVFGPYDAQRGVWTIERASDSTLDGSERPLRLQRLGLDLARVAADGFDGAWEVLEWSDA